VFDLRDIMADRGLVTLCGVPEGLDGLIAGDFVKALAGAGRRGLAIHVARDDQRMATMVDALGFFAPDIEVLRFPAWDCIPYDRVSPRADIVAQRMATLARLAAPGDSPNPPRLVLTTVNAALQRVVRPEVIAGASWSARPGARVSMDALADYLSRNGFSRTGTVVEPGDYAIRGGIVDIFAPGTALPVRLDLFGDTLESIRSFDPQTQRTTGQLQALDLLPASEILLSEASVRLFRSQYVAAFGAVTDADPLYESISQGRHFQGMEHWLPLFHDGLATLFDYAGDAPILLDHLADDARRSRIEQIGEYYEARKAALAQSGFGAPPYKPVAPETLFLGEDDWSEALAGRMTRALTPFDVPDGGSTGRVIAVGGRQGRSFAAERAEEGRNVFDALREHVNALKARRKTVVIASWSAGSRDRLSGVLADHDFGPMAPVADWAEAIRLPAGTTALAVLGIEAGFETDDLAVIGEQDVLGDRLVRRGRKVSRAADFITEASSLTSGDLVVHVDHGIGRFEGLKTIDVQGAPHDCLFLTYQGGDRLFLPVENIELLSRYGSDEAGVQLDRLGGSAWQARKARLKQRIRDMADQLIKTAAARMLRSGEVMTPPDGLYDEFSARFPFEETEDQARAIDAVLGDLASGRPMDRLVCGDVGFGKTEVALRSAFIAVLSGRQVAVVVPTTLLARQHFQTFCERFKGLPVRLGHASRLVGARDLAATKEGLASGDIDIVIGTHALLGKSIRFRHLGLLIVDEEQHFGVAHKERLKDLRADVHVLTLSATPIPRTLQLALTGVRELSLIATPPVDRLAVRTFISPFDPVILREALLRELYRGGQSFYVCPRVSDIAEIREYLADHVPEAKVAVAHGQMAPGQLEDIMTAFYDRKYDILLSTTIIESGLDIPTANTLIVHRADMFGLAQLYQLRGRVGRSKTRAYALFTIPAGKTLTPAAEKRLKVLQSLDSLGAGFSLASHDLDIRGAGNLLGEEQSGHIKEVGFELYQDMLEEAVASLRAGDTEMAGDEQWSPQINIGAAVLIPETYVSDLELRLGLYRRLSGLETQDQVESFAAEMIDRFGSLPQEVEHLMQIVAIKLLCRRAGIASVDAGPKGVVLRFRKDTFANPGGLVRFIGAEGKLARLRPDHRLVLMRDWDSAEERLKGSWVLLRQLARIAEEAATAAA
jgi:transcription-repair coupling factor (superfamily II helicase)